MNVDKIKWYHSINGQPIHLFPINRPTDVTVQQTEVVETPKRKQKDPVRIAYYKEVWRITERNASKIKNIGLRGSDYHLDHIIPISYGFKHTIKPTVIGGVKNLRIITRMENFKKNSRFLII
jgi:hypothetical protein